MAGHWAAKKNLVPCDFTSRAAPPKEAYSVDPKFSYARAVLRHSSWNGPDPAILNISYADSYRIWVKKQSDSIKPTSGQARRTAVPSVSVNECGYQNGLTALGFAA